MLEKDIQHTTYIHVSLREGTVYIHCGLCGLEVKASSTEETKVQTGETLITVGGERVPKRGGRVTWSRVRRFKVPVYEWLNLCFNCRGMEGGENHAAHPETR